MAEMKFEEALKKLEKIVDDLEAGDIALDEALKRYEEGVQLARLCEKRLEQARKKIEVLSKGEDGSVQLKPFDEDLKQGGLKTSGASRKRAKS